MKFYTTRCKQETLRGKFLIQCDPNTGDTQKTTVTKHEKL